MIVTKEIPLCGGRNRGFAKYRLFLTIQDLMGKLQARKERVSEIQETMSA